MLRDLKAGIVRADVLIIYSVDRLGRDLKHNIEAMIEISNYVKQVVFVAERITSDSSHFKILFLMLTGMAQETRESLLRRLSDGRKAKVLSRKSFDGNYPALGYVKNKEKLVPATFENTNDLQQSQGLITLQVIFHSYLFGMSLRSIAKMLNERVGFTRRGKEWTYKSVQYILLNEIYCGTLKGTMQKVENYVVKNANVVPLVDPLVFELVQKKLQYEQPGRKRKSINRSPHFTLCSACLEPLKEEANSLSQIVMMGLQVELENKQRNQRIVESAKSKYRQGKFIYPRKPYGYDIDENYYLIIKEDEAAIVRRIFKEFLKGKGLMQIARELNAEGLYNKEKEKPWSNVKVNTILERKTYTGIIYRKEYENDQYIYNKISDKKHPVIISEEMFEEVQKIKQQKVRKKKEIKNSHFLSGILVCPNCQSKMYGQSERDIYQCKGNKTNHSTCPTIKKAVVEKLVFQWLIQKDASNSTFNSNERNNVQEDQVYKKIMVEKEQCELKFAKALISTETYTKNMESINERLKQLQEGKDILVYIQETETYESLIKENNLEQLKKRLKKENIRFTFDEEMKIIQLEDKPTT